MITTNWTLCLFRNEEEEDYDQWKWWREKKLKEFEIDEKSRVIQKKKRKYKNNTNIMGWSLMAVLFTVD